ncbi:Anti-sigma-K factor RskA [Actinokineospora alba]|uniref:Regulator of SigK n=1 Tax=Actinokineospora alba TaxID=504798 RepID=A0A1H0I0I4_9PSEU|nr:anti-sigma factor [Actinokineospora alba]TDP64663.1 anti-sigma-K factor RskA [Actinokineospora alba]SDI84662.1 Anti-sigma-K factor RskA [Actinokineospora alba]SDO24884.1 Anti-sigma-K factor RskA [Actinokineospora alba]
MTPDIHALTGAYVLNAVTETERADFERHLAECESCAEEVRELEATATRLGEAAAARPPAAMKAAVMTRIGDVRQLPPIGDELAVRRKRWSTRILGMAAAALLVVSVALGVALVQTQRDLDAGRRQGAAMAELLSASDARVVNGSTPAGLSGTVVVSRERGQVMLLADKIPAAPAGKTYQVWLIGGEKRSIGLLTPDERGKAHLLDASGVGDAVAIGVTVEPAGGSRQPTTDPVMAMTLPA